MNIFLGLSVLLIVAIIAVIYYRNKETFENGVVVGKFAEPIAENPTQSYTQQPLNLSFVFADPVGDNATSFDRVLSRFTDKKAPTALFQGASFPEAAPYSDSEVEAIAKKALSRVKGPDAPILDFISVEFAAKGVDNLKNAHFDISFIVYDPVQAYALKLVLVAVLDPTGRLWIKKFQSFNGASTSKDDDTPKGVMHVDYIELAPFENDFVSFEKLYADNKAL
ncbi:hypothetical protein PBCVNEJV1_147R [Paramecium bursaria Chlorella virus NE-JV-1]|nr:hypothetical protein PBCVNEJV1_147R [Paramecium bursaria Chlorella virus NE-JV-1]